MARARGTGRIFYKGKTLWIQFYDAAGRQRRESAAPEIKTLKGLDKKTHEERVEAEMKAAEKLLRKRIGARENDILPPPKKSRVTVSELYEDEMAYLLNDKPKTASWLKSRWDLRLSEHFGARRARDIRLADLNAYQAERMNCYRKLFPEASPKKMSACQSAVNSDLAALRMMFYKGKELEKIDVVPTFPKKLDGAMERVGTVTEEQYQAMLAACLPDELWLKTSLVMSVTWGYRLRELLNLQCARVNLRDGTVYLPPRSTKNKHPRLVPISVAEVPLLKVCVAGKAPQDFVLTRKDGKRVLNLRTRWEQLVDEAKAGHAEITQDGEQTWFPAIPHDLRRTAVSRMLSGGMPPESVRAIVGHISPEMTQKYYRPALETLRRLRRAAESQFALLTNEGEITQNRLLVNGAGTGPTPEKTEDSPRQAL